MVYNDEDWAVKQKLGMVQKRTTKLFKGEFLAVKRKIKEKKKKK